MMVVYPSSESRFRILGMSKGVVDRGRGAFGHGDQPGGLRGPPPRVRDSSSYIATFEPAATFADFVEAEGIRRGAGDVRQLTILGDGAACGSAIPTSG